MTAEGVLEAARVIRSYLPGLVGVEASEVDAQVAALLAAATGGADVLADLQAVLDRRSQTSAFLDAILADAPDFRPPELQPDTLRSAYGSLPGHTLPIPADKFTCPEGDYVWYRPDVGTLVVQCPSHHCTLQPA